MASNLSFKSEINNSWLKQYLSCVLSTIPFLFICSAKAVYKMDNTGKAKTTEQDSTDAYGYTARYRIFQIRINSLIGEK